MSVIRAAGGCFAAVLLLFPTVAGIPLPAAPDGPLPAALPPCFGRDVFHVETPCVQIQDGAGMRIVLEGKGPALDDIPLPPLPELPVDEVEVELTAKVKGTPVCDGVITPAPEAVQDLPSVLDNPAFADVLVKVLIWLAGELAWDGINGLAEGTRYRWDVTCKLAPAGLEVYGAGWGSVARRVSLVKYQDVNENSEERAPIAPPCEYYAGLPLIDNCREEHRRATWQNPHTIQNRTGDYGTAPAYGEAVVPQTARPCFDISEIYAVNEPHVVGRPEKEARGTTACGPEVEITWVNNIPDYDFDCVGQYGATFVCK